MTTELNIAATDDETAIREKIAAILEPLTPEQRRAALRSIDRQLDAAICANEGHKGVGYPGCPVCGPRTRAELAERGMGTDW